MNMFLLGCIILFILVIFTAAVKTKKSNNQATRNRRNNHKDNSYSSVNNDELNNNQQTFDADEILGLNSDPFISFSEPKSEFVDEINDDIDEVVSPAPVVASKQAMQETSVIKYVVLYVMAPHGKQFGGYNLLQALLSRGLRYGKGGIFHRHEHKNGNGDKIFSLASVNNPGTFHLPNMSSFVCPGLALFMVLKDCQDPREVFELFLETAKMLAEDLGGEIHDESHKILNADKVRIMRKEIDAFVESHHIEDLFAV